MSQDPLALTPEEQYVVFAALCTMIDDVHAVQDTMTDEQWTLAEDLYKRLTTRVEAHEKAKHKSCTSSKKQQGVPLESSALPSKSATTPKRKRSSL